MNQDNILAKLKKDVRSLLVSSKLGLDPDKLSRDYTTMLGHPLPLKLLGFRNVMDMVKDMPDVVSVNFNNNGGIYLKAVSDESTRNIIELVAKQRTSTADKKTKKYLPHRNFHQSSSVILPRRGGAPLALPPQLRAKLRLLLSQGPLKMSELEISFLRCFGQPLRVHEFGFYTTGEMLQAAEDLVQVEQSRFGSILILRDRMVPRPLLSPFRKQPSPGPAKTVTPTTNTKVQIPTKSQGDVPLHLTGNCINTVSTNVSCKQQVIEKNQESEPKPCQESLIHQRFLELEKEFCQQIVENGVAGTINHELKEKLLKIVGQNDCGLSVHNLPNEYKRLFGEDLPLKENGFVSVTELVDAMSDIFHLQPAEKDSGHHWLIKNIQACTPLPSGDLDAINQPNTRSHFGDSLWEGKEDGGHDSSVDQDEELLASNHSMNQEGMSEMCPAIKVYCSTSIPPDAMQTQRLKQPTQHAIRELVQVRVEQVESPGLFYICFNESEEARELVDMMVKMRRCYSSPEISARYHLQEQFVRQGQVCCVSSKYMFFYRGVIHHVFSLNKVEVYLVDFGNIITVNIADLKFLKSSFSSLPAQAVPSSLAGIKPTTGVWTSEATASFAKLCCDRTLVAAPYCYTRDVLQLYLCDTHTDEDIYIHQYLMSKGHGVACSPSVSAELCVQFSPVSLYLGEGTFDLPHIEDSNTCSLQPAESMLAALEPEADELPDLELIEDNEFSIHSQNLSLTHEEDKQDPMVTEASTVSLPHAFKTLKQHQDCSIQGTHRSRYLGIHVKQEPRLGLGFLPWLG
ncbi:tudor domain-containing protein 5 isoform X1 [Entelurus aequoreus]|uniref:tudor domain-containing protein 5 isoform X1 n=1 Tax=Entelurus aequoreus TaxID=161455 RepID=UPI002B1E0AF9|nr:tudor domain-containing protein 5 isoform X1 [Entelurus aequoreus]